MFIGWFLEIERESEGDTEGERGAEMAGDPLPTTPLGALLLHDGDPFWRPK